MIGSMPTMPPLGFAPAFPVQSAPGFTQAYPGPRQGLQSLPAASPPGMDTRPATRPPTALVQQTPAPPRPLVRAQAEDEPVPARRSTLGASSPMLLTMPS